jgi:hypothetical protein
VPEFAAIVDEADDEVAGTARDVGRRRGARQAFAASAQVAREAPEMVLELIMGILP